MTAWPTVLQGLTALGALGSLAILVKYTKATIALRDAAVRQAQAATDLVETSMMPYVTLVFEADQPLTAAATAAYASIAGEPPPPVVHLLGGRATFANIGRGPAIEVVYTFLGDSSHVLPHLDSGQCFEPPVGGIGSSREACELVVRYKSLTGTAYTSEFRLERGTTGLVATKVTVRQV
jgi:hypothetical protein